MTAFKLLTALFSLLDSVTKYFADRELISLGEARALADMHAKAAERVTKALEAREAMERALDSDGGVRVRDWDQDRRPN
jgi:hypothetical protein